MLANGSIRNSIVVVVGSNLNRSLWHGEPDILLTFVTFVVVWSGLVWSGLVLALALALALAAVVAEQ